MIVQLRAERIRCQGNWLYGILHLPAQPLARGVLIVTGGPQYRAGSHRQFVLLARRLADAGIPVLRFDYSGMGDSEGERRDFEQIGPDLHAAIRHFFHAVPGLRELVLWGLCDGASAALFHAAQDSRIRGLILLNPWVRTEQGAARVTLRHYYAARLRDPEFWRKLGAGRFKLGASLRSFARLAGAARAPAPEAEAERLPERLCAALERFDGPVLFILAGADLTAQEFRDLQNGDARWRRLMTAPRIRQVCLEQANHTFARAVWREQVASLSADWIASW